MLEEGCAAWLECRLIRDRTPKTPTTPVLPEIVAAAADERVFQAGHWRFNDGNTELQTIHHLGGGNFVRPAVLFAAGDAAMARPQSRPA